MTEHLPNMHEALGSRPGTLKKKSIKSKLSCSEFWLLHKPPLPGQASPLLVWLLLIPPTGFLSLIWVETLRAEAFPIQLCSLDFTKQGAATGVCWNQCPSHAMSKWLILLIHSLSPSIPRHLIAHFTRQFDSLSLLIKYKSLLTGTASVTCSNTHSAFTSRANLFHWL